MNERTATEPTCVFCGAPWSEPMIEDLHVSSGCDTCGFGSGARGEIVINCSGCGREVYRKKFDNIGW